MGNIKVEFLNKEYLFSDELVMYVKCLNKFQPYYERALEPLICQMEEKTYSSGDESEFMYFRNPLREIVEDVIKDFAKEGIFTVSRKELLDDNEGYKKLWETCNKGFQEIKNIYLRSIENYMDGYEKEYDSTNQKITESDYVIITNTFSDLLTYNIIGSNAINKQMKRAEKVYRKRVKELINQYDDENSQQEAIYLACSYYPHVAVALGEFIDEILKRYVISTFINKNYDLNEINNYDIKRSNDLLENLSILDNKTEVIRQSFEACPYNIKIYEYAIKNNILDNNSIDIISVFGLKELIINQLKEICLDSKNNNSNMKNFVEMLTILTNEKENVIYRNIYKMEIENFKNAILDFVKMSKNKSLLIKWIINNIDDSATNFIKKSEEEIKNITINYLENNIFTRDVKELIEMNVIDINDLNFDDGSKLCFDNATLKLGEKITKYVIEYKEEITNEVKNLDSKLDFLNSQIEEAKDKWNFKNKTWNETLENLISEKESLGILAFKRKKNLELEIEKIKTDIDNNLYKDEYLKKDKEYEEVKKQLENLMQCD